MNDTLAVKPVTLANISGDDYSSPVNYPRVVSPTPNEHHRRYFNGSSSYLLRIAHQPSKAGSPIRSLMGVTLELQRVNADSGALERTESVAVNVQCTRTVGVNLTEFDEAISHAVGALIEFRNSFYNQEF
jgi:hypothetical protein